MTFRSIHGAVAFNTTKLEADVADGLRATYLDEWRAAVGARDFASAHAALELHAEVSTAIMEARAWQRTEDLKHALRR